MKHEKAFGLLNIKAVDDRKRTFKGIASTITADRSADVVEPKGAQFKLPMPFLYQHDSRRPIGHITSASVSAGDIQVEGYIEDIPDAPPSLKERLDVAWAELKAGLVRGLSIGFIPLESSYNNETGGMHFLRWDWFELSLVTIPANAEASITAVKSIDARLRAPLRTKETIVYRLPAETSPPAAGKSTLNGDDMKTIQQRIADFKAARETEVKALGELVNKSIESGETLNAEDKQKHAEISDRIKEIDEHIEMLQSSEALMVAKAPTVAVEAGEGATAKASAVRGGAVELGGNNGGRGVIQLKEKLAPGVEFAIYAKCLAAAKGNPLVAVEIAKAHYANMEPLQAVLKAAVVGGTTTLSGFASQLVDYQRMADEFLEYLMPQTVIGKFGQNGIPDVTRVPFNVELSSMTNTGTAAWVGEGKAKPVTRQTYANLTLGITKIAAITVLTDELLRLSNPRADVLTRDALAKAVTYRMNYDFLDPAKSASANVSPASITYDATNFVASGTGDADDIVADMQKALGYFNAANIPATSLVWIMPSMVALALSNKLSALGAPQYPTMTMRGGSLGGIPVIVTDYVSSDVTSGSTVILASAENILLADDGVIVIDASNQVSIEMQDSMTSDATSGTGASLVSMWQTNSTAFRAERWINWRTARTPSVVYITAVQWGEA
jgi:HK97 family phage prohead protease/HK97 family phage major capsid protein